jgi:hypothetical protein
MPESPEPLRLTVPQSLFDRLNNIAFRERGAGLALSARRDPRWVLDLLARNMTAYVESRGFHESSRHGVNTLLDGEQAAKSVALGDLALVFLEAETEGAEVVVSVVEPGPPVPLETVRTRQQIPGVREMFRFQAQPGPAQP